MQVFRQYHHRHDRKRMRGFDLGFINNRLSAAFGGFG